MITHFLRLILARQIEPFIFKGGIKDEINYEQKNIGIYIHIPFCEKICSFCPYNKVEYDKKLAEKYFTALIKEIDLVGRKLKKRKEVTSLYFGGGSPALAGNHLSKITEKVREYFDIKGNCGIELHPSNINITTLNEIKKAGFDMVSIGVQSFQEKCLETLGREKTDIAPLLKLVAEIGFKAIDVDLIFGILGQNNADLENDFSAAVLNGATQISTYPFIDFSYANNKKKPLGQKDKKKMLETLSRTSERLGYCRNSIWTFIKKDTPKYSSITRDNFIGFGPSATTLVKECFKVNTFSLDEYIKRVEEAQIPTALTLAFNERARALYWLFWSCYNMSIDRKAFKEIFNKELEEFFGGELNVSSKLGFIERNLSGYNLTEKGMYYFHIVEQKYTHQYIDKTWKIAGQKAWPEKIKLY